MDDQGGGETREGRFDERKVGYSRQSTCELMDGSNRSPLRESGDRSARSQYRSLALGAYRTQDRGYCLVEY